MFTRVRKLLDNMRKVDTDAILKHIFEDKSLQDYVIELNQKQLLKGLDSNDDRLGKSDSRIDLFETGRFFSTFTLHNEYGNLELRANTKIYGKDFKILYGDAIIGLTKSDLEKVAQKIKPLVIIEIKKALNDGI